MRGGRLSPVRAVVDCIIHNPTPQAIWVKSYYLFMLGNVWNNFFGNCMQIASTYFGQLFDGAERDSSSGPSRVCHKA